VKRRDTAVTDSARSRRAVGSLAPGRSRPARWLAIRACLLAFLGMMLSATGVAEVVRFDRMERLESSSRSPPPAGDAWLETALPDAVANRMHGGEPRTAWYRASFSFTGRPQEQVSWAVYLPFLYEGGQVWINGVLVGGVPESDAEHKVRWERPHLVPFPPLLLHPGMNEVAVRAGSGRERTVLRFPQLSVAPQAELQGEYDRRLFWVRTTPQITVVVCLLGAGLMLFIWWRRRSEVLYGLFGLAAAMWGVRTLTFVIDTMPMAHWQTWRLAYLTATGGFIVMLALFALRYAGLRKPWIERLLVLYWLLGPLALALGGLPVEAVVNQAWSAGLLPIGASILAVSVWVMMKRRTLSAMVLPVALSVAVLAGVHDYLIAWDVEVIARVWPEWAHQRLFLLHYGANLLLLAMGVLLTARFIATLRALEELNQTLESRVAERERHLAANFERMARLQHETSVANERQLIMRELHDGLGSRLFTSLMRVERGAMDNREIAEALRGCIADMRLAIDALAPEDDDFRTALGNFLFRWQAQLEEAHIVPAWTIDVPESALSVSPQASLALLRVAQEALTNVLKHARAGQVTVRLRQSRGVLELEVADDGQGSGARADWRDSAASSAADGLPLVRPPTGRGLDNMRARARQLGGSLDVQWSEHGTRVLLRVPMTATVVA
jgi:signal transduction histidine kinase